MSDTTKTIDDGGPAFPRTGEGFGNPKYDTPGITVRAYLAAKAMQSVLWGWYEGGAKEDTAETYEAMARHCVNAADALIAELKKGR